MLARHLLHVFPAFAVGGQQARFCALANHFGPRYRHTVVSINGDLSCRERLLAGVDVTFVTAPGRLGMLSALRKLRPHVLVTHNWGAIEWAVAHAVWPVARHIHIEDGFGPEERERQLPRRALTRRFALRRSTVVLPSRTLLAIARDIWRLPEARLLYLPNGIDLTRFAPPADLRQDEIVTVGTVAALRPEKNIARLLRAFAAASSTARLLIVGDGPEREALEAEASKLGIADRVRFAGHRADTRASYAEMDVFALSSDTEQMPLTLLEAMACGLPVAATDVGDVRSMLPEGNARYVVPRDDAALAGALVSLISYPATRAIVGIANRTQAEARFDQEKMFAGYATLFDE